MALILASVADLQAALPGVDDAAAASALLRASALVRGVAQQDFDFIPHDTITLTGGSADLLLPQRPVYVDGSHPLLVSESSTTYAGSQRLSTNFSRVGDTLSKHPASMYGPFHNLMWGQGWPVGIWAPYVTVTYSHGYLTPPAWLSAIVLNAAITYATNPMGLASKTVGGKAVTWQRHTVTARADVLDQIKADLHAVGIRRGGAFSIRPT